MGLIKYRDTKTQRLTEETDIFVAQLHEEYPHMDPDLLCSIANMIGGCITDECMHYAVSNEKKINNQEIITVIEKMNDIRNKNGPVPEGLDKISGRYKYFIALTQNPGVCSVTNYLRFHGHMDYQGIQTADDAKRVEEVTHAIFDRIRAGTEAGLYGELSAEEEKSFRRSKDPEYRRRYEKHIQQKVTAANTLWNSLPSVHTVEETSDPEDTPMIETEEMHAPTKRVRISPSF